MGEHEDETKDGSAIGLKDSGIIEEESDRNDSTILEILSDHDEFDDLVDKEQQNGSLSERLGSSPLKIMQVDGEVGDYSDDDEPSPVDDHADDEDYIPEASTSGASRAPRRRKENKKSKAIKAITRNFSENRTVYYHEDFDSMSEEDEEILTKKKQKKKKKKKKKKKS